MGTFRISFNPCLLRLSAWLTRKHSRTLYGARRCVIEYRCAGRHRHSLLLIVWRHSGGARHLGAPLVSAWIRYQLVYHCTDRAANHAWPASGDSARLMRRDAFRGVSAFALRAGSVDCPRLRHSVSCRLLLAVNGSVGSAA